MNNIETVGCIQKDLSKESHVCQISIEIAPSFFYGPAILYLPFFGLHSSIASIFPMKDESLMMPNIQIQL